MDKVTSLIDKCSHFVQVKDSLCHTLNIFSCHGINITEHGRQFSCLIVEEIHAAEV